jgi:hypothetical protein
MADPLEGMPHAQGHPLARPPGRLGMVRERVHRVSDPTAYVADKIDGGPALFLPRQGCHSPYQMGGIT